MPDTPATPRPRRPRTLPWTALAWCGAIAYPVVMHLAVLLAAHDDAILRLLLPAVVTGLLAGLLRRQPLVALALILAGSFYVAATLHAPDAGHLLVVVADAAVGFIVATRRRRVAVVASGLALGVQAASIPFYTFQSDSFLNSTLFLALAMVTAWAVGSVIRERRTHAEALRVQATTQAVTAERLRIARELHDMVSHSIGIIAIQAGVGSRVIDTQPAEARNALATIEATSRETLAGLRRALGALRRTDSVPGSPPVQVHPTPGLADVDRLAAATTDAGIQVAVRWRGRRRPVPADIELSAFRIIQEAVTNVVRHADTPHCRVTVDYRDDALTIEVVDDGRGCTAVKSGYGIAGMRERTALLHGRFTAESRPEGGFRVAACLPLPAGAR